MSTHSLSHTCHAIATRSLALFACLLVLGLSYLSFPQTSLAAERQPVTHQTEALFFSAPDDPFGTIRTKLEDLAKDIAKLSTPVAILGIIMVLLLLLFSPLLPEMAQQHKGYIIRALMIVSVISLIPEIVKAFSSLGA